MVYSSPEPLVCLVATVALQARDNMRGTFALGYNVIVAA